MRRPHPKNEAVVAIIVALLVLFSAMWDPMISVIVSLAALISFAGYKFQQK